MTLSKRQREVIDLMGEGWELVIMTTFDGGAYLSKKGSSFKNIHSNTAMSLRDKGLISTPKYNFPSMRYKLTDKAKGL